LLSDITCERLPPRRDRHNPRVVKRKMSNFKLKRPAHANTLHPKPIADTIRILGTVK
jgi:hypothetical protein